MARAESLHQKPHLQMNRGHAIIGIGLAVGVAAYADLLYFEPRSTNSEIDKSGSYRPTSQEVAKATNEIALYHRNVDSAIKDNQPPPAAEAGIIKDFEILDQKAKIATMRNEISSKRDWVDLAGIAGAIVAFMFGLREVQKKS